MLVYKAKGDNGKNRIFKFPCRLSGRLGKSSVILKDRHKPTVKRVTRERMGKRTEGKENRRERPTNTNCLKKNLKRIW